MNSKSNKQFQHGVKIGFSLQQYDDRNHVYFLPTTLSLVAFNAGDPGSIPGSGRSPGEGNGNTLHYFCLGNLMDRGAWWATVHGFAKNQTVLGD